MDEIIIPKGVRQIRWLKDHANLQIQVVLEVQLPDDTWKQIAFPYLELQLFVDKAREMGTA